MMIANATGTYKTRTVKRVPHEERWGAENINLVLGTVWNPMNTEGKDSELMPAIQIEMKEPMVQVEKPMSRKGHTLPRRMYINKKDIDLHGPTPGCPGCHAS